MKRSLTAAALILAAVVLAGCTVTTNGVAVKRVSPRIPIENLGSDPSSVFVQDIVTDTVEYWEGRGASLASIRFIQWDSTRGDDPMMCAGSMYPQPAYCREGWLAWDHAWVLRALKSDPIAMTVYVSRAVSDAVADKTGIPFNPLSAVNIQECFTGAYMSGRSDATSKTMRNFITNPSAYIRGLESTDPIADCLNL